MSIDRREDAGDFYPGGKVISTRPVATGGDVKHSDFAGLDVKTNTIPDLRDAVRELGRRLGATVVTALAVCVAIAATVQTVPVNDLDFDANPSVVTNVTFEGLAQEGELESIRVAIESNRVEIASNRVEIASNRVEIASNRVEIASNADSISTLNDTKASKADATLNLRGPNHDGFSAWEITWVNPYYPDPIDGVTWHDGNWYLTVNGQAEVNTAISDRNAVSIDVPAAKAIRTALQGYILGPNEQTNPNRDKPLASEAEAEALRNGKANNADVVHKTGDETIAGDKTFTGGNTVIPFITAGQGSVRIGISGRISQATAGGLLDDTYVPNYGEVKSTITAAISPTAPAFSNAVLSVGLGIDTNTVAVINELVDSAHDLPVTGATSVGALLLALAAALAALKKRLPYAISESTPLTVTSGAAATTLADRMHNVRTVAAPGVGNTTTITVTLPPIVAGKSRDMFLNLTVGTQASDAGDISLSIVEPSGATVQIDIGSVEDIGIGKNEILISENALPTTSGNVTTTHWLVTVRHEDFAS